MKPPRSTTWLFGNPVSVTLLAGLTCYLVYEWWTGTNSGVFAIVSALVTLSATNANARLNKYNGWKREWDALNGAPEQTGPVFSGRTVRVFLALPVWCVCAFVAAAVADDPVGRIGADLFWLATAVGIAGSIFQWLRSRPLNERATVKGTDLPVRLCVPVPKMSTDLAQAFGALPHYCLTVLSHVRG